MHIGYQVSNILESVASNSTNIAESLYLCHNSTFDLYLSYCDIELNNYDTNNKKFLENNKRISTWPTNSLIKAYSSHIVNNALAYLKNSNGLNFHLNTIIFTHDTSLLSLKKEDAFLLCTNAFRTNDTLVYFNSIVSNYNCPKITTVKLEYAIPDEINDLKQDRTGIAIFCYNKTIGQDLVDGISPGASQLASLPSSLDELNKELNKYELFVELDPGSIINALTGIASGGVSIILDPNNSLMEYKNIPNLYIANSLPELHSIISKSPKRVSDTAIFDSRFKNFKAFHEKISSIIQASQRKAFVI